MKRATKIGWVLITFAILLGGFFLLSGNSSKAEEAETKEVGGVVVTADGSSLVGSSYVDNMPSSPISDITIPSTVKSIPASYFQNATNITSITIESSDRMDIGSSAFVGCSELESINLGNLTSLGLNVFSGCLKLSIIKVSGSTYSVDGYYALYTGSTLVYVPPGAEETYKVKDGTTRISTGALTNSNVRTITIPASVTSIENQLPWKPLKVYTSSGSYADNLYSTDPEVYVITDGSSGGDDPDDDGGDDSGGGSGGGGSSSGQGSSGGGSSSSAGGSSGSGLVKYMIIEGANQTVGASSGTVTMKANGDFAKFAFVMVDGAIIDKTNYTAKSGSTVITFKAEYIKSLANGAHTIRVYYSDSGYAETMLTISSSTKKTTTTVTYTVNSDGTVTKGTGKDATPTTADGFDERMLLVLAILLCGIGTILYSKNKKLELITSGYDD